MKGFADKQCMIEIPITVLEEVFEKGHSDFTLPDGSIKRLDMTNIYLSRADVIKMAKAEGLKLPPELQDQ